MPFKWKEGYSCNIKEIDDQHKNLFELGSRIYTIATLKDKFDHYDEILSILGELKDYTIYHFDYEEKLMKEYGFEHYESHKVEHDLFIKKIEHIGRKNIDEEQGKAIMALITFIADWISGHILKADNQYISFFNSKGLF